jgi:hypothetical protein
MADRLKSLRRIGAVQAQMVRLAEWRLIEAERSCRDLKDAKTNLQSYVIEEGSLGVALAKAALRSLQAVETRLRIAEDNRTQNRAVLEAVKRRGKALENLTEEVARRAERTREDQALAETIEVWLARKGDSLP